MAIIGFVQSYYSVREGSDKFVNLSLALNSGQLGREVVVMLSTCNGDSALSKYLENACKMASYIIFIMFYMV